MRPVRTIAGLGVVLLTALAIAWSVRTSPEACLAAPVAERLNRSALLVGGAMDPRSFARAPFDLRYHYAAGGVPDAPCDDCRACTVEGVTCENPTPCGWWGCWQDDTLRPGVFFREFVRDTEARGALPMVTWYQWYYVAGGIEGPEAIAALADGDRVGRYLLDLRALLRTLEGAALGPFLVHLEPDLWGFARKVDPDPRQIPVALDGTLCAGWPAHLAGFRGEGSVDFDGVSRSDPPSIGAFEFAP